MDDKELVWLHGEVKTPPFSHEARIEVGAFLRSLQQGATLSMPHSRPMPSIGAKCHELRVPDQDNTWRIIYGLEQDAVIIGEVFAKRTQTTPQTIIVNCKRRFAMYNKV